VTVGGHAVRVELTDWCGCPNGRVIDLARTAFARLAPPSRGLVRVVVSW
jgi:rare lipoprotein A (peptidoglycan hydrolase)